MTRAHSRGRLFGSPGLRAAIGEPSLGRRRDPTTAADDDDDDDDDDDFVNDDSDDDDSDAGVVAVVVVVVVARLKIAARLKKAPNPRFLSWLTPSRRLGTMFKCAMR
jgi:hypothetical protein